jgi:hypothetical protein
MTQKYLFLNWVGGSGGNWLRYLIYLLEHNIKDTRIVNRVHYHKTPISIQFQKLIEILGDHAVAHENSYYYNGFCRFNFYLNCMVKYNIHDCKIDHEPVLNQIDTFASCAGYTILYPENTDLDYTWLYTDPEKFIDELFFFLDSIGFIYFKNRDVCHAKILEFKKTCIDPQQHLGNWESNLWIGFCLGIMKSKKIPLPFNFFEVSNNEDVLIDYLKNNENELVQATENLTLYV